MLGLLPQLPRGRALRLLFLGAHADDIEIGCGGTVLSLLRDRPGCEVNWVVFSADKVREREARRAATALLKKAGKATIHVADFRECFFPSQYADIKARLEDIARGLSPDIVFTHQREDLHQDHRVLGELAWNTFRNHLILEYEIPKFDGGLGSPQVFVPVDRALAKRKVSLLMKVFASQLQRNWFTPETFMALMRLRGIECQSPSGLAEAYYVRKIVMAA